MKKQKERDDAWSKTEDNTFNYGSQPMDIDIEETNDNMNSEEEETEENEGASPLEGWLTEDKSEYGDLFNESNEIGDKAKVEPDVDYKHKERNKGKNKAKRNNTNSEDKTRTEIDLTEINDEDDSNEMEEKMDDDKKERAETMRKDDRERNAEKGHNGKKNINKSASKTKTATTPKATKGTTKGQKDKNETTKTPIPRKRFGSEFTSFKKVNYKSSNRCICKIKKGNEKLNNDDTLDKSNKLLYPHIEITRVSLKLKVPAAQDKCGATMNVLKEFSPN